MVGLYGLVSLNTSEPSKSVSQSFSLTNLFSDASGTQNLSFYYYFTVPKDIPDRGQQIQIWIQSDDEMDETLSLANLTVADMPDYRWQSRTYTFNLRSNVYTVNHLL